jgi:hypothetical protein
MPKADPAVRVSAGIVLFLLAAAIGAILLGGCGSWQKTSTKALYGVTAAAAEARPIVQKLCDEQLAKCIAAKANPCPALDACIDKRIAPANKALASIQSAVVVGTLGVEVGDQPGVSRAMLAALEAWAVLSKNLAQWGVKLPMVGGAK